MKARIIESDGIRIYSESFGNTQDPTVLLIMGATASGAWWPDEFCTALAGSGRFVIRYDHRDTGGSTSYEPGAAPYSVEDLADDAVRVLNGYGIQKAHVVGMSLGGYISQLLALKVPDQILTVTTIASERLASADPAMPGIAPELLEYHSRAADLDWSDRDAVIEYWVGAWRLLSGSAHEFDPELIRKMAATDLARTPNPLTAFNHAALGDAVGWLDRLKEIRQATLVIHGTDDIVLPYVHAEALHKAIPNARLMTLDGVGHELPRAVWPDVLREIHQHTGVGEQGPA
ncbi:putative esterase [Solimonas flava]|uniref:putative esterase n=1 Tax=Solimonas flava TaxID=415849 RepID=UPI000486BE45|nr:putative esterase [Solimonas flava]